MSYLAEQLQLPEAKQRYTLMADSLRDAVRQWCWDEKDGMYYSVDLNLVAYTGEPQIIFGKPFVLHQGAPRDYPCLIQRIGCWSGFMTLWAGIATPEQARRMVKENLLDERTFWGGRPIMNPGFQNWNYLVLNMVAWLEGRPVVREY